MKDSFRFDWRPVAAFVIALAATAASAQTPLALPDVPIGSAGIVSAIARQSDGSLIVGGVFTRIDGVPRTSLARLHPDGTLDLDWHPSLDGSVDAIVIDANDDVIVAGSFDHVGGLARNSLAKLAGRGSGEVFDAWNPGAMLHSVALRMLAIGPDGDVFTAGDLVDDRLVDYHVAKIAANGTVDLDWHPQIENTVDAIAADPFGALYVGVSGWGTCCLLKLQTSGHGDPVPGWQPHEVGGSGMVVGADGFLYLPRSPMMRFAPDSHGDVDPDWHPDISAGQGMTAFTMDGDAIYAALDVAYPGRDARIVKVTGDGTITEWQTQGRGVSVLAIGADHSLYAGGVFEGPGGVPPGLQPKLSLARLAATDGSALATVDATGPGTVNAIARQPNGGTIIGGQFSRAGTTPRRNLVRLLPDGRIDPAWNAGFDHFEVDAIAVDSNNAVYVGGTDPFASEPVPVQKFAGSGNGAPDAHWSAATDGSVTALAVDARGGLHVGGSFSTVHAGPNGGGIDRQNLIRLATADATPDVAWTASTADPVQAILVDDAEAAVYIASGRVSHGAPGSGFGTVYSGALAKVHIAAASADDWSREFVGIPYALSLGHDHALFAGGYFENPTGWSDVMKVSTASGAIDLAWGEATSSSIDWRTARAIASDATGIHTGGTLVHDNGDGSQVNGPYLARRRTNGALDADWAPSIGGTSIRAIVPAGDALYVGGGFMTIGDTARDSLAAVSTARADAPGYGHSQHRGPGLLAPRPVASPVRLRPPATAPGPMQGAPSRRSQ